MSIFSAIIIDDQKEAIDSLSKMIAHFFNEDIKIIGTFESGEEAITFLSETESNLIFIDMEMPGLNGLETINLLPNNLKSKIIVVSGKEKYAINALKYNVYDYILKPLSISDFKILIERLRNENEINNSKNEQLKSNTIIIDCKTKTYFLDFTLINHIQSIASHTIIYSQNKEILIPKTLKYFEEILPKSLFFAPHRSHIVNLNFVKELRKSEDNNVIMFLKDDTQIEMSKKKKASFMSQFKYKF
jgi:two-component system LytT family response regulator